MKRVSFPNCCAANILLDLGGTSLTGMYKDAYSEEELRGWLEHQIAEDGESIAFVVITNDQQELANKLLRELGFNHSPWMSKGVHIESKIRLWWKPPMV